jgi:hypothetical protein
MRVRRSALAAVVAAALSLPALSLASPFTVTYTFTGSPGNQVSEPVDANPVGALFSAITRGPGIAPIAGMNSINSDGWSTGFAIDLNDYYEWTITPSAGFELDVTDLEFSMRRSGTGPRLFELRNSLNGFATPFGSASIADVTDNIRLGFNVPGGFNGSLNLTSPITFRIYGYGAEGPLGTFRLGIALGEVAESLPANLVVGGDLAEAPEPTTLLLLGAGLSALGLRRRRQRAQSAR